MSVFRDIEIDYDGKSYTLTPTNRLLRKVESGLAPSSLVGMIGRVATENPPVSEVAYVSAEFLAAAGVADVDEDAMFLELMEDLANGGEVFSMLCATIIQAISPAEETAKKSLGTGKAKAKKGKTKK
jgi:hypothetical protein